MHNLRSNFAILLSLLAVIVVVWVGYGGSTPSDRQPDSNQNPVYTRVLDSGQLRVGYIVFPPYISKNSATGQISGIFYDFTEELGRNLGLKIVWVEEVNLTNLSVGFTNNRIDMIVTPLWRSAARARSVRFSVPLFYSVVGTYVRSSDNRFDKDLGRLNSSDITVAAIDGELAGEISKIDFPKAKVSSLPQLVDFSRGC